MLSSRLMSRVAGNSVLVSIALGLGSPHLTAGQQRISSEPTCSACSLDIEWVSRIHDSDGRAGLIEKPLWVARSDVGSILLISNRFEPLLFNAQGVFQRQLGRKGEGPEEFRHPTLGTFAGDDNIHIFDAGLGRRSIWRPDGTFVTSRRIPNQPFRHAVLFPDGSFVFNAAYATADRVGLPYHQVSSEGQLERSFGMEQNVRAPGDFTTLRRKLATSVEQGGFWSAHELEYVVEHYEPDGSSTSYSRTVDWFPRSDAFRSATSVVPFTPHILSIEQQSNGLLWVLVAIPDRQWTRGLGEPREDYPGVTHYPIVDWDAAYDSVIEIIDPQSGTLLLSRRFDQHLFQFLGGGHVARYRVDEFGVPMIDIAAVRLVQPTGGAR